MPTPTRIQSAGEAAGWVTRTRLATYGAFLKARLQGGQPRKTALACHTEAKIFWWRGWRTGGFAGTSEQICRLYRLGLSPLATSICFSWTTTSMDSMNGLLASDSFSQISGSNS